MFKLCIKQFIYKQEQTNFNTMENSNNTSEPTPQNIMQIGTGFMASKILLSAVKFGLFTLLAKHEKMSAEQIKMILKLNCSNRNLYDFLDTLASLGFLERDGILENASYTNSLDTATFLDKNKPSYIGGILEMANNRLYQFWGDLENGLTSGLPQNELKNGADNPFTEIYKTPEKLSEFIQAMGGIQMGNFMAFAKKFDFSKYKTLTDAGGASALLSVMVAKHQPHMKCISLDLEAVKSIADSNIKQFQLTDRVQAVNGDFFTDNLPKADIVVMGNILHDWDENKKISLMKKAYDALPQGGAFVAIENVIDNDRKKNIFGLMMSINMLIETGKGFDYTFNDFNTWAKTVGFKNTDIMPLAGPASAAIAYK